MPVIFERKLPHQFNVTVARGKYQIKLLQVNYRTLLDFVWHRNDLEMELEKTIAAWNERNLELEICVINNTVNNPRLYLSYYRVTAIQTQ